MTDLHGYFQRCYVVNLRRRADRWQEFSTRIGPGWPFVAPERWPAIDGKLVPHPTWWRVGGGAWGCFASHRGILEKCLNDEVRSVLILEDDAVFCPDFARKVLTFLDAVPQDWQMLYLGGQHLNQDRHLPQSVNEQVWRPYNVNRTHAFALSRRGMEIVYRHLCRRDWQKKHHVDHHLGRLHASGKIAVYCPPVWLVGQAQSRSNISGATHDTQFWGGAQEIQPDARLPAVVAVVGPQRSGTSCVAGILHQLGVSMGRKFPAPNRHNPKGFFEGKWLRRICWAAYKEPHMRERNTYAQRVEALRGWLVGRRGDGAVVGAKHPTLCLLVPEMAEAWPELRIVAMVRPIADVTASLRKAGWWRRLGDEQVEKITRRMFETRDHDIATLGVQRLTLTLDEVVADPAGTVDRLAAFCGISPSVPQRQAAIAFIDPALQHHGHPQRKGQAA